MCQQSCCWFLAAGVSSGALWSWNNSSKFPPTIFCLPSEIQASAFHSFGLGLDPLFKIQFFSGSGWEAEMSAFQTLLITSNALWIKRPWALKRLGYCEVYTFEGSSAAPHIIPIRVLEIDNPWDTFGDIIQFPGWYLRIVFYWLIKDIHINFLGVLHSADSH